MKRKKLGKYNRNVDREGKKTRNKDQETKTIKKTQSGEQGLKNKGQETRTI